MGWPAGRVRYSLTLLGGCGWLMCLKHETAEYGAMDLEAVRRNHDALMKDMQKQPEHPDPGLAREWADAIRQGKVLFYDERAVKTGLSNVDWSGSHVHHQEWRAQLNRFLCLPYLTDVHRKGEGDDLPALARTLIQDWIDQHDYDSDTPLDPEDSTLNLSVRLGQSSRRGWWPAVAAFDRPDVFDAEFLETMRESTRGQLDCLRKNLRSRGNWRVSELDTIIYCSLVVPGLDEHLGFAVRMINECFHRQIHPDGSHEEHCPGYHTWMCHVFTAYWRLSRARPELGLKFDAERITLMWDYTVCCRLPNGDLCPINDTRLGHRKAPIQELEKERSEVLAEAGLDGPERDLNAVPSRYFPDAGQIFLRTDWSPEAAFTSFDASRWGGWHSHLSRNGISFFDKGSYLLPDPGIFSYEKSDPFAAYGRSTRAHNTAAFDFMNQSEENPDTHSVYLFEAFGVVASRYQGGYYGGDFYGNWYGGHQPGVFGHHERIMLWLGKWGNIVWDFFNVDRKGQRICTHWNLPLGGVGLDASAGRAWSRNAPPNVYIQLAGSSQPVECGIVEGINPPLHGWTPQHMSAADYAPSPMVRYEQVAMEQSAHSSFILASYDDPSPPEIVPELFTCWYDRARGIDIDFRDGRRAVVAATEGLAHQVGEAGRLDTDGSLAAVLIEDGAPVRSLLIDGMYLRFDSKMLIEGDCVVSEERLHG